MKWLSLGFLVVCALGGTVIVTKVLATECPLLFFVIMVFIMSWLFGSIIKDIYDYRKLK